MKLILMILVLFCLTGCYQIKYVDCQDKIEDNSIVFIKNDLSMSLLIKSDGEYSLIEIANKDKIYSISLDIQVDNLILLEDVITSMEYKYKYILNNVVILDNIRIEKDNKLLIKLKDNKFCIYDMNISEIGDYTECDFVYILNNEDNVFIKLNNDMKVLFYNQYAKFSSKFLEHVYTTWIDTYTINNNILTVLTMNENDFIIKNVENDVVD